jgi:tetratricopeptide (TPR) repeat protein
MTSAALFAIALALAAPALAQDEAYDPSLDRKRYDGCIRAIPTDAKSAEEFAVQWQAKGGGLPARHCQALAQLERGNNAAAAQTLAKAAQAAEAQKSPQAADFWGQAGNAALLAGDATGAVGHFNSAVVAAGEFAPIRTANLLIDRARAQVELANLAAARADLDRATGLAPNEPAGWLLSAALARRQQDLPRAKADIARAAALAPADPDILFEQGAVLAADGDLPGARAQWEQLAKTAPGTAAAALAARALQDAARP